MGSVRCGDLGAPGATRAPVLTTKSGMVHPVTLIVEITCYFAWIRYVLCDVVFCRNLLELIPVTNPQ